MNHESELSDRLLETAASVHPHADLMVVEQGARRVRSRRRLATGVVAAMLVAGAGGAGFGIGRNAARSDGEVTSAGVPADATTPTTTDVEAAARAEAEASAAAAADRAQAEAEAADRAAGATVAATTPANAVPATDFADGENYPPYELVYERTIDDGSYFRVSRGTNWDTREHGYYPEVPDWQPANFCFGSGELRLGFAGPGVIDVSGSEWFETPFHGVNVSVFDIGWADQQPLRVALVQATGDSTSARIVWDDGASDETALLNGYAVLRSPGTGAYQAPYTLELVGPSGTQSLTSAELDRYRNPEYRQACEPPPPALPDAGEQPPDATAAEAEVRANFLLLVDQSVPADEKPDNLLDDDTGVDEAIAAAREGGFGESVSSATYSVDELVFTSPTEAWFRYSIDTVNGLFNSRYGTAHLNDGVWQISRAVICADLGLAGAACEPYAERDPPAELVRAVRRRGRGGRGRRGVTGVETAPD